MTFPYDEANLAEVSDKVLTACLKCLTAFPTICKDDPMINFKVPSLIGFGIARGTACCLHADDLILDYSGHLLNLASRLMELARPGGIVIDGNYSKAIIPSGIRSRFAEQRVFLRGIAEDSPWTVFYLKDSVEISEFYLSPLLIEKWLRVDKTFSVAKWKKFESFEITLESAVKSPEKTKVTLIYPKKGVKGHDIIAEASQSCYSLKEEPEPCVIVDCEKMLKLAEPDVLSKATQVRIRVDYVPRPLPRT